MPDRIPAAAPTVTLALCIAGVALGAGRGAAQAPEGGVVAQGQARIEQTAGRSVIRQASRRAVIDWQGFDVGADHHVHFAQPGRDAATLNRVSAVRASTIAGAISAPGTVIIQNTAGVLIAGGARIDVGGLVATSQTVAADRFLRDGRLSIGGGERAGARVANHGEITIGEAGLAALVGRNVENAGAIVARRGTVALASGTRTTIDLSGDGTIQVAVDGDAPGGRVGNSGRIEADGGRVLLTAGGAADALDGVINTSGVIRATSGAAGGGTVRLIGRGDGTVSVTGAVDARGGTGGTIDVTGQRLRIGGSARLDASGTRGGGRIRLGGDVRGTGPLRRADHLDVAAGAVVAAAGGRGPGGQVVAWADQTTRFDGRIVATGARGGRAETSGGINLALGPNARVDLGPGGHWLLDPRDVEIAATGAAVPPGGTPPPGGGPFRVSATALEAALNGGADVTITTAQAGSSQRGDIHVNTPLAWTAPSTLRLEADRDATITRPVTTRDGDFIVNAADDVEVDAPITSTGAGNIDLTARATFVVNESDVRVEDRITASGSGDIRLSAPGGSVRIGRVNANVDGRLISTGSGDIAVTARDDITVNADVRVQGPGGVAMVAEAGDIATSRPNQALRITTESGPLRLEATGGSVILRRANQPPQAGNNIQVVSRTGDIDVVAGRDIRLVGDDKNGRWVRIRSTSQGDVRLRAGERITVAGGAAPDAFAEVVAGTGGWVSLEADAIEITSQASPGRVQAIGQAALTLRANTQTWAGPVQAGLAPLTGGETRIAGDITATVAPSFSLVEDRSFAFDARRPDGGASRYRSALPLDVDTSGTGTIEVGAPVEAGRIALISEERVGLGADAALRAAGPGDALVVAAGRRFRNDAGPSAFVTDDPAARWLLYIDGFAGLTGAAPGPRAFDLYGRPFQDFQPPDIGFADNRIVYGERPTLTLTGDSLAKTYGTAVIPGFTAAGLRPGDTLGVALATGPIVSSPGAAADAPASGSPYAVSVAAAASDQGYLVETVPGTLTVDRVALSVTVDDASRTYGAPNPALTATYAGFVLGEDASVLTGALGTDATQTSGAGAYVISAAGLGSPNYAITATPGTLSISPADLAVIANDAERAAGAPDPAFSARFEGFVLGEGPGDLDGRLALATPATMASPPGFYAITPGGLGAVNYAIRYVDGTLTVTGSSPPGPPIPPGPPVPPPGPPGPPSGGTGAQIALSLTAEPLRLGVPPLTPGDASFRTTDLDAPPAISNPFGLTYSLGEVIQLVPDGSPANGGFVPAAGTAAGPTDNDGGCGGPINRGAPAAGCARTAFPESYWSTIADGAP